MVSCPAKTIRECHGARDQPRGRDRESQVGTELLRPHGAAMETPKLTLELMVGSLLHQTEA